MPIDILAIGVHPDDVELSCSGTLLSALANGQSCAILDLTRGELGTRGTPATRAAEAQASAHILGIQHRENLGMADGFLQNDEAHQRQLIAAIRYWQPTIVLANALADRHPDHGKAARLVADACFLSGLRKIETVDKHGQVQAPHRPAQVFHYIQDRWLEPDFVLDISAHMDKKLASILAYGTQFNSPDNSEPQTYISTPAFLESVKAKDRLMGKKIGVDYAEGFQSEKTIGIRSFQDLIHQVT